LGGVLKGLKWGVTRKVGAPLAFGAFKLRKLPCITIGQVIMCPLMSAFSSVGSPYMIKANQIRSDFQGRPT